MLAQINYICVRCHSRWTKTIELDEGIYVPDESSGICKSCYRELRTDKIRQKQIEEGNWPCFATAIDFCDQFECCYRNQCLD